MNKLGFAKDMRSMGINNIAMLLHIILVTGNLYEGKILNSSLLNILHLYGLAFILIKSLDTDPDLISRPVFSTQF